MLEQGGRLQMIGLESHPKRTEGILQQRVKGTQVLLNMDSGQYYAIDEVGIRVWELSDGSRSVKQIVDLVAGEYDAPVETIRADVLELLGELEHEKLVVEAR
jgi:hypothetical protein